MQDDYQYQPLPLPPIRPYGGNVETNSGIPTIPAPVNIPLAAELETNDPFNNPASQPSTPGGTPPPLTCADSITVGDIQTNQVGFPCTGSPVAVIDQSNLTQDDGAGGTAQFSSAVGLITMTFGGQTVTIDLTTLPSGAVAQFREFTNCDGLSWYALSTEPTL